MSPFLRFLLPLYDTAFGFLLILCECRCVHAGVWETVREAITMFLPLGDIISQTPLGSLVMLLFVCSLHGPAGATWLMAGRESPIGFPLTTTEAQILTLFYRVFINFISFYEANMLLKEVCGRRNCQVEGTKMVVAVTATLQFAEQAMLLCVLSLKMEPNVIIVNAK